MAGDWIKMRTDLQSHPKVVRILSALCPQGVREQSEKFRVIGGLHAVWGIFDAHSEDGSLKGYTPDLLDHMIGWQGFSRALESVGWLLYDGLETLTLPEFTSHNGQSAKRRGEDQKRKRDGRKSCPQSVRKVSDEMRTREEKRREEKKEENSTQPPAADPLLGVDPKIARDFRKLRQAKRAAITQTAVDGIKREAEKAGLGLDAALAMCCERGWVGFKAEWVTGAKTETPARVRREL